MEATQISRSALDVEWQRLQVIATNLANMNTTRTGDGGTYTAQRLVSGPVGDFAAEMRAQGKTDGPPERGVMVYEITQTNSGSRQVFNPDHPHANEDGFVSYPNISQSDEMSLMIKTQRTYQANLVALQAAQRMFSSALQVGRQG